MVKLHTDYDIKDSKDVIEMLHLQGWKNKEIAYYLGISEGFFEKYRLGTRKSAKLYNSIDSLYDYSTENYLAYREKKRIEVQEAEIKKRIELENKEPMYKYGGLWFEVIISGMTFLHGRKWRFYTELDYQDSLKEVDNFYAYLCGQYENNANYQIQRLVDSDVW